MWLFDMSFGRPGSHLLVAWVASIAQRSVLEVYMPVLIAMRLALVAAAGGLVWREPTHRRAAFVTCWFHSLSLATSWVGLVGILVGAYAQYVSVTTRERFLTILGLGASAVGFFLGMAHGGLFVA